MQREIVLMQDAGQTGERRQYHLNSAFMPRLRRKENNSGTSGPQSSAHDCICVQLAQSHEMPLSRAKVQNLRTDPHFLAASRGASSKQRHVPYS